MVRRVEGQCCRGASSANAASLPCSTAFSRSCRVVENTEPICGLSVCSTAVAVFLRKLAFRHKPHYLGRGGIPPVLWISACPVRLRLKSCPNHAILYADTSSTNLHTLSQTSVTLDSFYDGFNAFVCTKIAKDGTTVLAQGCFSDNGQGVAYAIGNIPINLSGGPYSYAVDTSSYFDLYPGDIVSCSKVAHLLS
jgi:hypothetical protein